MSQTNVINVDPEAEYERLRRKGYSPQQADTFIENMAKKQIENIDREDKLEVIEVDDVANSVFAPAPCNGCEEVENDLGPGFIPPSGISPTVYHPKKAKKGQVPREDMLPVFEL